MRIGLSRVVPELKMFYRRPEQLALTFSMPAVICLLLGSIFSAKLPGTETSTGAVIAASMLAYGILSTSFINLGISIAADRETGALRRLRGTPATASSYFIGKIMLVAIASLAEAIILLLVGVLVFRLHLPTDVFGWFTLTWVFILGIISCSLLGIFVSNLAGNAVSAAVITNGPAVGLQFLSGTYVPLMVLPTWMLIVGSIFPVKWMAQGFRSVLLPPQMVVFEPAGSWEHWRTFLVLAAWSIGGLTGLPLRVPMVGQELMSMPSLLSITSHFFLQIAVILLTYRLLWPLFRRLAQVQVVAIMVAGFLLGPSVLGWIWPAGQHWLFPTKLTIGAETFTHPNLTAIYVVGQLGLVLYMFLVGASFKLDILGAHVRQAGVTSAAGIGVPLVLGGVVGWWMVGLGGYFTDKVVHWQGGLFVAAAVAITAFPMLAWIVYDSGLLNTRLGTMALSCAAVDDACSWVLLATVVATAKGSLFGAFLAIGGGLAYLLFMVYVGRPLLGEIGDVDAAPRRCRTHGRLTDRAYEHRSPRRADRELVHRSGRNLFRVRRFRGRRRHATRCAARGDPRAVRTAGRLSAVARVLHLFGAEHSAHPDIRRIHSAHGGHRARRILRREVRCHRTGSALAGHELVRGRFDGSTRQRSRPDGTHLAQHRIRGGTHLGEALHHIGAHDDHHHVRRHTAAATVRTPPEEVGIEVRPCRGGTSRRSVSSSVRIWFVVAIAHARGGVGGRTNVPTRQRC